MLDQLAGQRPVFHSEADFQHALAWLVHEMDPRIRVRLETKPKPGVRLDLSFERPDLGLTTAVELKYMTGKLEHTLAGEVFRLAKQGAPDLHCYDVLNDVVRLERFVAAKPGWTGLLVAITNESGYWTDRSGGRMTNATAFRLYEGTTVDGVRDWGPKTGEGTKRTRELALRFAASYVIRWRDYSDLGVPRGRFRALVVEVVSSPYWIAGSEVPTMARPTTTVTEILTAYRDGAVPREQMLDEMRHYPWKAVESSNPEPNYFSEPAWENLDWPQPGTVQEVYAAEASGVISQDDEDAITDLIRRLAAPARPRSHS